MSDLVKLLWVVDNNLDSHLHLGLLQAEVQASNLGVNDTLYHAFGKTQNSMFDRGNIQRIWLTILKHTFYFRLLFYCLARKVVPQFTNYCG